MLSCLIACLYAFLPGSWTAQNAKQDIAESDEIVLVRCIGLHLVEEIELPDKNAQGAQNVEVHIRSYLADCQVAKTLKGHDLGQVTIPISIGYDISTDTSQTIQPADEWLTLCNSQAGFDLRINQVYVLCLSKDHAGRYFPRSGPFSIGWVKPRDVICFGLLGWKWQDPISYNTFRMTIK